MANSGSGFFKQIKAVTNIQLLTICSVESNILQIFGESLPIVDYQLDIKMPCIVAVGRAATSVTREPGSEPYYKKSQVKSSAS